MIKKKAYDLALLFFFVFLTHFLFFFFKESTLFVDQDQWIYSMHAIEWAKGIRFTFFPSGLDYSGIGIVDFVRIVLTTVVNLFTQNEMILWEQLQLFISFCISPFLMSCSVYYFLTAYYPKLSLVSLFLIAVGLPFELFFHGVDPYLHAVVFIFLILGFRARHNDPLKNISLKRVFLLGMFCGFSTSVLRSSFLAVPLLFISNQNFTKMIHVFQKPKNRTLKKLNTIIFLLLGFGVFLALIGGSKVLDTTAHFKYTFLLILIHFITSKVFHDRLLLLKRALLFMGAFVLGFLPEAIHKAVYKMPWLKSKGSQTGELNLNSFLQALREFLVGYDYNPHWLSVFYLVFFALVAFAFAAFLRKQHLHTRKVVFILPLIVAGLNFFAFFQIAYSHPGSARYLIGFFPFFYLSLVSGIEDSFWLKKKKIFLSSILIILILFCFQKTQIWKKYYNQRSYLEIKQLVQLLRVEKIKFVWAEDFKMSTTYSNFSRGNPWFVQDSYLRVPQITDATIHSQTKIATCSHNRYKHLPLGLTKAFGKQWEVKYELGQTLDITHCWVMVAKP